MLWCHNMPNMVQNNCIKIIKLFKEDCKFCCSVWNGGVTKGECLWTSGQSSWVKLPVRDTGHFSLHSMANPGGSWYRHSVCAEWKKKKKKKYTALTKIKVCAIINLSLLRCLNCNEKCVQQGKKYHDIMSRIFYVSNRGNDISSMTEFQRINRIMLRSQVHTHFLKVNY